MKCGSLFNAWKNELQVYEQTLAKFWNQTFDRYSVVFISDIHHACKNHLNADVNWKCAITGNIDYKETIYIEKQH